MGEGGRVFVMGGKESLLWEREVMSRCYGRGR